MPLIVAGTGTDIGKTLFSSLVMARYGKTQQLRYCKPVQTGPASDRAAVQALTGLDDVHFFPELASFALAASPHLAAEREGRQIDVAALQRYMADCAGQAPVVFELAGGLMVPLRRYATNLDLIRSTGLPVVLVASTSLGTINHTVLSWQALHHAGAVCCGIFFIGPENELYADNARSIAEMTGAKILGELFLPPDRLISRADLAEAAADFDAADEIRKLL